MVRAGPLLPMESRVTCTTMSRPRLMTSLIRGRRSPWALGGAFSWYASGTMSSRGRNPWRGAPMSTKQALRLGSTLATVPR